MWCHIVVAALVTAAVAGQSRVTYNGRPLPEGPMFLVPTEEEQQQQQQQQQQQSSVSQLQSLGVPVEQQQQQQQQQQQHQFLQFPQSQPSFVMPAFQTQPQLLPVPMGQQQQPRFFTVPTVPQPQVFVAPPVQQLSPPLEPPVFVVSPQPVSNVVPSQQLVATFPQQVMAQGFLPQPPAACPATQSLVHASFRDSLYHLSWCRQPGQTFTHQQAADYCLSLNYQQYERHFEVLSVDDLEEAAFITDLLRSYLHSAVWTKHTSSTALYSTRRFINRLGASRPGSDCLSVVTRLFSHSQWLHERRCTDQQLVICEAR